MNNPNDSDLSYKTDLDFWDGFGRKKKLCLITKEIRYLRVSFFLVFQGLDYLCLYILFKSISVICLDDVRMIMKGCVQRKPV